MSRAFHECFAIGCHRRIYLHLLMCSLHWRRVPQNLRREVWTTYRPGQEKPGSPPASTAYFEAIQAAQAAVAALEGQDHDQT